MGTESKGRRLGRGLHSLMQSPVAIEPSAKEHADQVQNTSVPEQAPDVMVERVAIDAIEPSPFQPRRGELDDASLHRLAESIRRSGVIQPVIARPVAPGRYQLIAGERRWRAARLAKLEAIPAIVREVTDEVAAQWALVENLQREDLDPMERAFALRQLGERFGLSHAEIGERSGLSRSSVANLVRLTELEEEIQAMLAGGALSTGHGKALLGIADGPARVEVAHRAVSDHLTVREMEQMARDLAEGGARAGDQLGPVPDSRPAPVKDLEKQLSEHLGTKVTVSTNRTGDRGRITIAFYGLDHFDGLMAKMGFRLR